MDSYLRALVNSATAPIRALVNAVRARLSSIWGIIVGFFMSVRREEITLRSRVSDWVHAQILHARAVATTLKWIVTVYIPRKVSQEASSIRTWTSGLISDAKALAAQGLSELKTLALDGLAVLHVGLSDLRTWATSLFGPIVTLLNRLASQVFGVLSTPERLAQWIVVAMARALVSFLIDNFDPIVTYVWQHKGPLIAKSDDMIEEVLIRLL